MKVIGYYNSFERSIVLPNLYLDALTHINYSFLLPKADGSVYFRNEEDVIRVVNIAREHNIKVFLSVGGWCDGDLILSDVFDTICNNKNTLDCFISNIIHVVEKHQFDGIDLDWEYPTTERKDEFNYLIDKLSNYMHLQRKEISIAIYHSVLGDKKFDRISAITDDIISKLDWLNIMTYDCHDEPNHSSLLLAKKCVNYWTRERGISKEKIMIGVPFYAKPSMEKYYKLVAKDYRNAFEDFIDGDSQNGVFTIKEKAKFAKSNCGGLIIWAINYDSLNEQFSLLKAIKNSI